MSTETIKRKIAALRAKTVEAGCTEAEAIAAAALAAKLMADHQISEAEIGMVTARARVAMQLPRWQHWLASVICGLTNTHAMISRDAIANIEFAGREHSVEIALYLRDVLTRAVNAGIAELRRTPTYRRLRKASSKSSAVNSFAAGMIARLSERLKPMLPGTMDAGEAAAAREMMVALHPDSKSSSRPAPALTNHAAYAAGTRAGATVSLGHGVAGNAGAPALIGGGS